ncbi:MAG: hypothetical protein HQM09_22925 [Candidatus Riflebacteria bacterium]|nr:hypothetical protein [Candidatus Riflebacteria bacterium]
MNNTVVTGLGMISASGLGIESNYRNFQLKKSGIQRITRFEIPAKVKTDIAGLVPDIPSEKLPQHLVSRMNDEDLRQDYVKAAVFVADEAIREAGINEKIQMNPRRTGLFVASSLGNFLYVSELVKDYFMKQLYKITSLIHGMNSYLPSRLADLFGIKGPCLFVSSSCTSSLNAILQADTLIRSGFIDRAVICAVDVCLEVGTYHLWNKIRVLSHRNDDPPTACRPYCMTRDGIVVSEAAGCFVLEREGAAGAPYARIRGFGMSNGASDFLKPTPEDISRAIRDGIDNAGISADDIDFIAGSASGSPHCDHFETRAIREIFGPAAADRIPLFAFKSFLGTAFGTQAITEGALALRAFRENRLPEPRNIFEKDERVCANAYYNPNDYHGYDMNNHYCPV